jgi:hypothetical protein
MKRWASGGTAIGDGRATGDGLTIGAGEDAILGLSVEQDAQQNANRPKQAKARAMVKTLNLHEMSILMGRFKQIYHQVGQ